jgi:cell division protein FtsB
LTDLERRSAALDAEIGRTRAENRALKDELQALEADPTYIESLLRRWRMAGPRERLIVE